MPDYFWCQPQVYLDGLELRAPSPAALALEPVFREHERVVRSPQHDALAVRRLNGNSYAGTTVTPPPPSTEPDAHKWWAEVGYYTVGLDYGVTAMQAAINPHVKRNFKQVRAPYRDAYPVRRTPGTDSLLPLRPLQPE